MYEYKAKIVRVIDGDTLEVDIDLGFKTTLQREKLRLIGIDTPEIRSSNLKEKEHGLLAKTYVEKLLPVGSEILVKTEKDKTGKYGRYLARVFVGELELNQLLKENGFEKKEKY